MNPSSSYSLPAASLDYVSNMSDSRAYRYQHYFQERGLTQPTTEQIMEFIKYDLNQQYQLQLQAAKRSSQSQSQYNSSSSNGPPAASQSAMRPSMSNADLQGQSMSLSSMPPAVSTSAAHPPSSSNPAPAPVSSLAQLPPASADEIARVSRVLSAAHTQVAADFASSSSDLMARYFTHFREPHRISSSQHELMSGLHKGGRVGNNGKYKTITEFMAEQKQIQTDKRAKRALELAANPPPPRPPVPAVAAADREEKAAAATGANKRKRAPAEEDPEWGGSEERYDVADRPRKGGRPSEAASSNNNSASAAAAEGAAAGADKLEQWNSGDWAFDYSLFHQKVQTITRAHQCRIADESVMEYLGQGVMNYIKETIEELMEFKRRRCGEEQIKAPMVEIMDPLREFKEYSRELEKNNYAAHLEWMKLFPDDKPSAQPVAPLASGPVDMESRSLPYNDPSTPLTLTDAISWMSRHPQWRRSDRLLQLMFLRATKLNRWPEMIAQGNKNGR